MRIAVTGASGNVGSAVVRAALRSGAEVVGVVRRVPPDRAAPPGTQWVRCDIGAVDADASLRAAFTGADAVVHLAWAIQPSHDRRRLIRTNLLGTEAVIAAAEAAGVPHLVHASSVGAYSAGPKDRLVDESWPTDGIPSSSYSRDKVAAERLLDAAQNRLETVTRVRPALVVQKRAAAELLRYFLPAIARPVARVPLPLLPLPDRTVTQVVHADDVADAVLRILAARPGGAFNLAPADSLGPDALAAAFGGRRVPLPAGLLRTAATATWTTHLQPVDVGWVDMLLGHPLLDSSRARGELGWSPLHTAADALTDVIAGIRANAGDRSPLLRPLRIFS
ncbi:NAD-dependent epimerase/dehydratase family protein [Cryptosporangium phraense]|uniref:NAD-dependent epimerase/dehydratase family protein n=1 Tax=Cryptosporangium phraense TaxID=2593070 RepID=A0A545ALJ0_9ACTN|nr:NAD-dependent epimerase/dehydratase family protein [Cryptosporangium phraense]TQS42183.1 NAD-dependent epimerase/dehydratase family protein [Cryptosporangium phraense]